MKAITVKQPWSSLIVEGIKDIENRTWKCPQKYIGKRILIHAGADKSLDRIPLDEFFTKDQICNLRSWFSENELCKMEFVHGAIIGSVEIVGCVVDHSSIWAEKTNFMRGDKPIYNWVFANPIKFPEPIPCKGKLSFWDYPDFLLGKDVKGLPY